MLVSECHNNGLYGVEGNRLNSLPEGTLVSPTRTIKDALIYYGYPSSVNGSGGDVSKAIDAFKKFDLIVFGDDLKEPNHSDNAKTRQIIAGLKDYNPKIEIFGYVQIGMDGSAGSDLPFVEIQRQIGLWEQAGVTGIFLDEFGYDYKVTRERQNQCVDYCHSKGFNIIANYWKVSYVFSSSNIYIDWINFNGNPNNIPPTINENDYYMYESLFFSKGSAGEQRVSKTSRLRDITDYYADKRPELGNKTYREYFGTKTIGLDVMVERNQDYFNTAYIGALMCGIDSYACNIGGYTNRNLPDYTKPQLPAVLFDSQLGVVVSATFDGQEHAQFTNRYGDEIEFKLLWRQDDASERNPVTGIRGVYVNGTPLKPINAGLPYEANVGDMYFNMLTGRPVWWSGAKWINSDGTDA
ncbi:hypothetical protein [Paenibacillus sp. GCM10027626]|uniref:hypothetical protein n=1 Tax=Paenibacillus sp. GCM10027626 TaxID=3273411 RepID=UPI0036396615